MLDVAAVMCMSLTMFHEARGEPVSGQVAVGYVLYRRADFNPKNICTETFKAQQFEWTSKTKHVPDYKTLKPFVLLSQKIIRQEIKDSSKGSSYFHHIKMPNQWGMKPRTVINNHVFY
jgi:spore germination cell wall hydrolase CwlJ-like protein